MLRIIAGRARGRHLHVPAGDRVRPTSDKVRGALFNVLEHRIGVDFEDARVLDLFAGAGSLGLEAASRGADVVWQVELDARVRDTLARNRELVGVGGQLVRQGVAAFLAGPPPAEPFDLVFLDPPYGRGLVDPTLKALCGEGWLAAHAVVIVEHPSDEPVRAPPGLETRFTRDYGVTSLTILAREAAMQRSAIYPGSFDPITTGHVDIIRRGLHLFDRVLVAVAVNMRKQPCFTDDERTEMIRATFADEARIEVVSFSGLLVDYARRQGIRPVLRGLRAVSDFEYEFQMASMNRRLTDEVDFVFMMTSDEHFFVSSSLVREIAMNGGDVRSLVPATVLPHLTRRFGPRAGEG